MEGIGEEAGRGLFQVADVVPAFSLRDLGSPPLSTVLRVCMSWLAHGSEEVEEREWGSLGPRPEHMVSVSEEKIRRGRAGHAWLPARRGPHQRILLLVRVTYFPGAYTCLRQKT